MQTINRRQEQDGTQTPPKRPLRLLKKGTRRKKQAEAGKAPQYTGAALKRLENAI